MRDTHQLGKMPMQQLEKPTRINWLSAVLCTGHPPQPHLHTWPYKFLNDLPIRLLPKACPCLCQVRHPLVVDVCEELEQRPNPGSTKSCAPCMHRRQWSKGTW